MKKIAVHGGVFHADEVFAVAMLQGIFDELEVIRTRDKKIIEICDFAVDVGDGKYDHHQVDKELREDGIPYSAFGLVWRDFGSTYISKHFTGITDEQIEEVVTKVAYNFITQIDASDNGVDINTYEIPITTISQVISSFMPFGGTALEVEEGFREAAQFAKTFFYKIVRKEVEYYNNFNYIKEQLEQQPIEEKRYLILDKTVGWKDPLLKLDDTERVLYIVYEDITGSWRVQAAPKAPKSFESRLDLPQAWGGLRDDEMDHITGVTGCIFCHPGLFICGHQTKQGAILLAEKAVHCQEIPS